MWFIVVWAFFSIFIYCECGEQVTAVFGVFDHEFNQCNWYLLSNEAQQIFLKAMINVQHPTTIRGYGRVLCSRIGFKQVHINISIDKIKSLLIICLF